MSDSQVSKTGQDMENRFFRASVSDFKNIPGHPIVYWIGDKISKTFDEPTLAELIETEGQNKTANNEKYVRLMWEVDRSSIGVELHWLPYAKGGDYRKWFGNLQHVVDWSESARFHYRRDSSCRIIADAFWYREGLTWTDITSGGTAFRFLPEGATFDMSGPTAFFAHGEEIFKCSALLNSNYTKYILPVLNPTLHAQLRDIKSIPQLRLAKNNPRCTEISKACIDISRADWNSYETSLDFTSLPLVHPEHRQPELKAIYQKLRAHWRDMTLEMQLLEEENNRIFIDAYGLQDELSPDVPLKEVTLTCNPDYRYGADKSEEELEALLLADTMRELVSYAVGCMFGRYSLDKPGLVLANQGETLADYLVQVPQPTFPADDDNVIPVLDGDWFPDDITLRFRQFLRVAFGEAHYEDNLAFIEQALNAKGKRNYSLRDYFLGEFYADHVKRYKKRPIYWLFSSPKGTFSALVYLHRYRTDTVSVVLSYLRDFRKKLASRLDYLQQAAISTSTSSSEKTKAIKEAETVKKQLLELDDYERDTLYPLATEQRELDLDDGVKANYLKLGAALKKIPGLDAKGED